MLSRKAATTHSACAHGPRRSRCERTKDLRCTKRKPGWPQTGSILSAFRTHNHTARGTAMMPHMMAIQGEDTHEDGEGKDEYTCGEIDQTNCPPMCGSDSQDPTAVGARGNSTTQHPRSCATRDHPTMTGLHLHLRPGFHLLQQTH